MKFGLIGDGKIAQRHRKAISHIGGEIAWVYDPLKYPTFGNIELSRHVDYWVICSPSDKHREQTLLALENNCKVIVEKPAVLPWEPLIESNDVNVVLQYRWADIPKKADFVFCHVVRDNPSFWNSWYGDPRKTGGFFYDLFIHYIDLALHLDCEFRGRVTTVKGEQGRYIDDLDLFSLDTQDLYNRMYEDIVLNNKGIHPQDLFQLHWIMQEYSRKYGYGKELLEKSILIPRYWP